MTRTIGNVLALGLSVKRTAGMKGNTCDVLVGALFFILCLGYFSFTPTLTPNYQSQIVRTLPPMVSNGSGHIDNAMKSQVERSQYC